MASADDSPDEFVYDARDQLRHDLKSPLTTIHARAQLLARGIHRSPSLTEEERGQMLAGLGEIQAMVHEMVAKIDGIRNGGRGR
jgi:signal transduction histidine kinase